MTIGEMVQSLRDKVWDTNLSSPVFEDPVYERVLREAMFIHFTGTYTDLNTIPDEKFPVMLLLAASIAATMHSSQQSNISNSTDVNNENQTRVAVNLGGALSVSETNAVDTGTSTKTGSKSVTNWKNVAEFYKELYEKATVVTEGSETPLPYIEQGYVTRTSKLTGATNRAQWMRNPPAATLSTLDTGTSEVLLKWTFPVNAALEQASKYEIWYGTNTNVKQWSNTKFTLGTTVSHKRGFSTGALETRVAKVSGLTTGTTYYFKLFVFNVDGNQQPSESNELSVTTT